MDSLLRQSQSNAPDKCNEKIHHMNKETND